MTRLCFSLLSLTHLTSSFSLLPACNSHSQPNPIATTYPKDVTGTINGTTAIIPIPYSTARSIIPSQYPILTKTYQALFPTLGEGLYPAVLEAVQDHDVQFTPLRIPDFTRAAIKFPFVDRLRDGYTSFKYTPVQLVSATNPIALLGSKLYGDVRPAVFDPPCDAYARNESGATYLDAWVVPTAGGAKPDVATRFEAVDSLPWSLEAFINITNQPLISSAPLTLPFCDNYITLFNSSVTTGRFAPVPVKGTVALRPPVYPREVVFGDVFGLRMDNAFIERNFVKCGDLRGYSWMRVGDNGGDGWGQVTDVGEGRR